MKAGGKVQVIQKQLTVAETSLSVWKSKTKILSIYFWK
jgi:hypothetical protein